MAKKSPHDAAPTITSVADAAGVSVATVSNVLNRKRGRTNEATRQRVIDAADRMGYRPDPRFRLMARHRTDGQPGTGQFGLLLPDSLTSRFLAERFHSRLFWALENEARAHRHHLVIGVIEAHEYLPLFVTDRQVDGAIVSGGVRPEVVRRVAELTPVVLVNAEVDGVDAPMIMPDEDASIEAALTHLRGLGHRRITYFDINETDPPSAHHLRRTEAFARLTAGDADTRQIALTCRDMPLRELAEQYLVAWRDQRHMPTALLCAADTYAIAFLEAAENLGIAVPETLSVIGIDDMWWGEHTRPRLTSIAQPLEAMGAHAIRTLMNMSNHDDPPTASRQTFPIELVERASTGPCPPCEVEAATSASTASAQVKSLSHAHS